MKVEPNWALFVEGKDVKWSFGSPDDEFLTIVTNFLTALAHIGEELFGQHGIAQINFDVKKRAGFNPSEVFVVSLENKFFLIMSDPSITMKLIEAHGGIDYEVQEIMSAVLVGQAAMLYSQCITDVEDKEAREYLESIWQDIILDISTDYRKDIDIIVGKNASNFSRLSFQDLLFLHYYLRKQPELIKPLSPTGWALISHMSGGEIPLDFEVCGHDPVVLAGYLAIIISFIMSLFNAKPKSLTFGTNNIQSLAFINGKEDYFMAIDSPFTDLSLIPEFNQIFSDLEDNVLEDLQKSLQNRVIEEIVAEKTRELEEMDFNTLLETYVLSSSQENHRKEKIQKKRILARIFGRL